MFYKCKIYFKRVVNNFFIKNRLSKSCFYGNFKLGMDKLVLFLDKF